MEGESIRKRIVPDGSLGSSCQVAYVNLRMPDVSEKPYGCVFVPEIAALFLMPRTQEEMVQKPAPDGVSWQTSFCQLPGSDLYTRVQHAKVDPRVSMDVWGSIVEEAVNLGHEVCNYGARTSLVGRVIDLAGKTWDTRLLNSANRVLHGNVTRALGYDPTPQAHLGTGRI